MIWIAVLVPWAIWLCLAFPWGEWWRKYSWGTPEPKRHDLT